MKQFNNSIQSLESFIDMTQQHIWSMRKLPDENKKDMIQMYNDCFKVFDTQNMDVIQMMEELRKHRRFVDVMQTYFELKNDTGMFEILKGLLD